ncbi:hypothetical protein V9T40_003748 [Parthenolecanium corni]|uniref:Uncharacterized protein n=1 Tax=Parthenolecanium corni TaxID=536013 RepID=A0AAN9U1E7_9HEMI
MSTKNLVYLSIQQTLQDLIYFITEMNVKHGFSEDTKWIAIGGAKGGSLAAWLRYLYSNVVHGAVASSAPMHFQPEIAGYYDTIGRILNDYNPRCKVAIEQAHAKLDEMSQSKNGRREISKLMNVCSQLSSLDMDYQFFMTIGMNYLCEVLEKDHSRKGVEQICTIMMNKSEESSPVERYSNVIRMIMNHKDEKCIATKFSDFAATLKTLDILPHTMKIKRADLYERCTQYGLFPTSTSSKSFHLSRSLKLDLYLVLCSIVVPFKVNENYLSEMTKKTNTAYAGLRIVANNLLFVGGTEDPSSQVQITSKDGKNEKKCEIIVVKGRLT